MERVVIADDLSGAAEIAGIAHRLGWRTHLSNNLETSPAADSDVQVWVIDTDSREVTENEAVKRCQSIGGLLARHFPGVPIFKKIDSVLRGHVAAECEVLQQQLNLHDVLLLPANPSRARCIRRGCYEIDGVPLSQTGFAQDPHYPAYSDDVHALLRTSSVTSARFVIPDVTTNEELKAIVARSVAPQTLIAGAADAFAAICPPAPYPSPAVSNHPIQTLILNGSAASQAEAISRLRKGGAFTLEAKDGVDRIPGALHSSKTVHVTLGAHQEEKLRGITAAIDAHQKLHLALTGGATARAICDLLKLDQFEVLGEWAPGVVRLRPTGRGDWEISVKPGSYAWPDSFLNHVV